MFLFGFIVGVIIGGFIFFFIGANNSKLKLKVHLDEQIANAQGDLAGQLQSALTSIKAKL